MSSAPRWTLIVHFGRPYLKFGPLGAVYKPMISIPDRGDAYATNGLLRCMAGDEDDDVEAPSDDRIIDSRAFQMGGGIDLDAFMTSDDCLLYTSPSPRD